MNGCQEGRKMVQSRERILDGIKRNWIGTHTRSHTCTHAHIHVNMCMHTHMHTHVNMCTHTCPHAHTLTHMCTHTYICMCANTSELKLERIGCAHCFLEKGNHRGKAHSCISTT